MVSTPIQSPILLASWEQMRGQVCSSKTGPYLLLVLSLQTTGSVHLGELSALHSYQLRLSPDHHRARQLHANCTRGKTEGMHTEGQLQQCGWLDLKVPRVLYAWGASRNEPVTGHQGVPERGVGVLCPWHQEAGQRVRTRVPTKLTFTCS